MSSASEALESFTITSAAVVNDTTFVFVAQASNTHPRWQNGNDFPARLVSHDRQKASWGWLEYGAFVNGVAGGATMPSGHRLALFVNVDGGVASLNYENGANDDEAPLNDPLTIGPRHLTFIASRFYGVGRDATVMRRNDPGNWERLHFEDGGPILRAIDGYSEADIYAAGLDQAVLHYDGTAWTKQEMPLDAMEERFRGMALVCAPDGLVHVGGQDGQLLIGRAGDRWEMAISEAEAGIGAIRGMTWFKGTLYATTDQALYRLVDRAWERAEFPESEVQPVGAGHLASNEDVMLLAGPYSAAIYDGRQWTPIHGAYDDLDQLRLHLVEKLVDDLETIRDTARDVADETGGSR